MKKTVSLILAFVMLIITAVPVFAAESGQTDLISARESGSSPVDSLINSIISFFERVGEFFMKIFGAGTIEVPAEAPDTIKSPDDGEEMRLVWHDEFNADSLDSTKWTLRAKMRQSDIINGNDEHNIKIEDGNLVLRTWKEDDTTFSTNTSVTTDGTMSFQYGYIEIYANVPYVDGCWPSFWFQSKDTHRTVGYMTGYGCQNPTLKLI